MPRVDSSQTLAKRVIPVVLVDGARLVKGIRFSDYREAGLAKSTLRVLNAQDPDELMILNISQTSANFEEAEKIILEAVQECDVPVTVGGGIRSIACAEKFFQAGVEKVLVTSELISNPELVFGLASRFGSQAVMAGLEIRVVENQLARCLKGVPVEIGLGLEAEIDMLQELGVGEILVLDVDNDGVRLGLNLNLLKRIRMASNVPVIGLGGVGNFDHLVEAFLECQVDAVACGSLFTFGDNNPIRVRAYLKNQGIPVRI